MSGDKSDSEVDFAGMVKRKTREVYKLQSGWASENRDANAAVTLSGEEIPLNNCSSADDASAEGEIPSRKRGRNNDAPEVASSERGGNANEQISQKIAKIEETARKNQMTSSIKCIQDPLQTGKPFSDTTVSFRDDSSEIEIDDFVDFRNIKSENKQSERDFFQSELEGFKEEDTK